MLSTITPMEERARRYTYGGTAAWFVVGAVLGGVTLGAATAVLAAGVSALDLDPDVALAAAAVLALVGAASDARLGEFGLPGHAPGQRDGSTATTHAAGSTAPASAGRSASASPPTS